MSDETQEPRKRNKQTHLSGNLGQDPKVFQTKTGGDLVKFSLAAPITFGTKDDPGDTFWVDVTIFDDKMKEQAYGPLNEETGERTRAPHALSKGDKVAVIGVLSFREVEGDDGQKRQFAGIIANRLAGPFDWWERTPYTPRPSSTSDDWQPPF